MNSLESKDMPLRTIDKFYQPFYKEKSSQGLKIFPEKHTNTQDTVLTPKGQLPSVSKYLSGLSQAKVLPRKIANKYEYYPLVKSCRKHLKKSAFLDDSPIQNMEEISGQKSRLQTLVSSHPSNRSIMVISHISRQQKKIQSEKELFRQTRSLRKEQKQKEMRFSFYNTIEKSDHFLRKFKEDCFIEERKTNNYQNMFKRTITSENILTILNKANQKYKMGL